LPILLPIRYVVDKERNDGRLELVVLLVKLALAMIPALFIIAAVSALFWEVFGALFGHHGTTTSM